MAFFQMRYTKCTQGNTSFTINLSAIVIPFLLQLKRSLFLQNVVSNAHRGTLFCKLCFIFDIHVIIINIILFVLVVFKSIFLCSQIKHLCIRILVFKFCTRLCILLYYILVNICPCPMILQWHFNDLNRNPGTFKSLFSDMKRMKEL